MSACPSCRAEVPDGARFCPTCGTRLEAAGPEATERKVVTTLFADLVGFTALGERHDPEDIDAALRRFYALARTIIERFGGTVEKFIGDAVVGLFGVPAAHEDDAERAVRAALELVARLHKLPPVGDERLQVRAAVNTGPALVRLHSRPETGEGVLVGDAVNTCARLLEEAPAMGVVSGEMTHRLSWRVIAYEELAPIAAKGKGAPVPRWLARQAIARRGKDMGRRDRTELVGREVELALLSGLIDRAVASGSPQYALVTGEAGIGKSRLVRELFRLVDTRQDFLCNWRQGTCPPYGNGLAYWALREIVGAHAGIDPGDAPDEVGRKLRNAVEGVDDADWLATRLRPLVGLAAPEAPHDENLNAWTRFFESIARARPAVVVIEDLHWASQSTLEFVQHFAVHASDVPLLLVATARPEFIEEHPDVFRQVPALTHVGLKALDAGESLRLARALLERDSDAGLAAEVAGRCGGNPLFAEELSRYLAVRGTTIDRELAPGRRRDEAETDAPTSLLALIGARLDALPPDQRSVVADASVIGPVFWTEAVAAVSQAGQDEVSAALQHLEERQFLRRHAESTMPGTVEMSFWHALVRDVAYGRLPRAARATRHLRAARWLVDRCGDNDDFIEVTAHHFETGLALAAACSRPDLVAGHQQLAQDAYVRAGDRALRLDVAAADHYYGLAMTVTGGHLVSPSLLLKRGEALRVIGRTADAARLQQRAVDVFAASGHPQRQAYALSRLAYTFSWSRQEESRRLAEQAVGMLDGTPSIEAIAVLETWATHQLWQADLSAVLDATERILGMSRLLGLPSPPRALGLHGYARFILGEARGIAEMEEAILTAEDVAASAHELYGLREVYARCLCIAADPEQALAAVRLWIDEAVQRRAEVSRVSFGIYETRYLLSCSRWDEALEVVALLGDDLIHRHHPPITETEFCALTVVAHLGRGTPREAHRAAERLARLLPRCPEPMLLGFIALAATEKKSRVAAHITRIIELPFTASFAQEPLDVLWWPLAVRTTLAAKRPDLAEQAARVALDWPSCPSRVRLTLDALLEESEGSAEEAALDYAAAARAWHSGKCPYEEGQALVGLGRCLLGMRRPVEADAALSTARLLFEGIGSCLAVGEVEHLRQNG